MDVRLVRPEACLHQLLPEHLHHQRRARLAPVDRVVQQTHRANHLAHLLLPVAAEPRAIADHRWSPCRPLADHHARDVRVLEDELFGGAGGEGRVTGGQLQQLVAVRGVGGEVVSQDRTQLLLAGDQVEEGRRVGGARGQVSGEEGREAATAGCARRRAWESRPGSRRWGTSPCHGR